MAESTTPAVGLPAPGEGVDQSRLSGAVGADEDRVLTALEAQRYLLQQDPGADLDPGALHLQHGKRPARSGVAKAKRRSR